MYSSEDDTSSDSELEEIAVKFGKNLKDKLDILSSKKHVKINIEHKTRKKVDESVRCTRSMKKLGGKLKECSEGTDGLLKNQPRVMGNKESEMHCSGYKSSPTEEKATDLEKTLNKDTVQLGFVIDKTGGIDDSDTSTDNDDSEFEGETSFKKGVKGDEIQKSDSVCHKGNKIHKKGILSSSIQSGLSITKDSYLKMKPQLNEQKKVNLSSLVKGSLSDHQVMKKSVLVPDIERKDVLPPYEESVRKIRKQRKLEKEKTKGKGWYGMTAPEMTESAKNDLTVLQMRRALDPKRFYKNSDIKALPKFFQFGTVIESPADFYHARIPKKQRKSTMVDELLADAEFRKYNKRKYIEIQEAKRKGVGAYKHMKRLKKNKR